MKGITVVNNLLCIDLDENNIDFNTDIEDQVTITCKHRHIGLIDQLKKNAQKQEALDFNHIAQSYVDRHEPQCADDILDMIRNRMGPEYPADGTIDYIKRNFE